MVPFFLGFGADVGGTKKPGHAAMTAKSSIHQLSRRNHARTFTRKIPQFSYMSFIGGHEKDQQLRTIAGITRASCSVSIVASILVITSFLCSNRFQTPVNRLVFLAAWGNMLADVASMISTSGTQHGEFSSLCQGQAFLLEWFVCASKNLVWCFYTIPR